MKFDHRNGRVIFTLLIGLLVAYLSYQWITNPDGREERLLQVAVVESSRVLITAVVAAGSIEIVDPLSPNRKVGKVYVYPEGDGWAVSGYYRRSEDDRWHPYLMMMKADHSLSSLKLQDKSPELLERAESDPLLEISS
jgi:hypothetical protein